MLLVAHSACTKEEVDNEKPIIDLGFNGAFPNNCDTLYLGEAFDLRAKFSDNKALGNYSIDIHNNFDHHSHSTEPGECVDGPDQTPVNPYVFIEDYVLPENQTSYDLVQPFELPESTPDNPIDTGDYHFYIRLTDQSGWSTQAGISIKILTR